MEYSIEVSGLSKHYSGFSLNDVSFTVPTGSIVGFIGENGAGKTTAIKAILGLIRTDGGQIRLFGQPVQHGKYWANEQIGSILESSFFSPRFTSTEIDQVMKLLHPSWDSALYWDLCQRFTLPKAKAYQEFSKGMRAKLAFATTLAHHPKLLILDEATSGLDPVVRSEILELLQEFILKENHSILLSSHITSDLEKVADYIVFIHNGHIVFQLSIDELAERFAVVKCSPEQYARLCNAHVLGKRESRFDVELLVDNAQQIKQAHSDVLIEPATIDDIMTFYMKGGNNE